MVGLIHECLLGFVTRNFGPEAVEKLERAAEVRGTFRIDTAYDDEQWQRLFAAAVELSGRSFDEFELAFARYCGEDLFQRFPGLVARAGSTREIIERQPVIHNNIAASLAEPARRREVSEKFEIEARPGETVVRYVSPNRLCGFYKGLAAWVAEYKSEVIEIDELSCQRRGAPACEIHLRYLGPSS